MKFKAMNQNAQIYQTQLGDTYVTLTPIYGFTIGKVDSKTFALPYGLLDYKGLLELKEHSNDYLNLLEDNATGIGTSRYGVNVSEAQSFLKEITDGDSGVLASALNGLLEDKDKIISYDEYRELISMLMEQGKLNVDKVTLSFIKKAGRTVNPLISNYFVPAIMELAQQLDDINFLDEIKDPSLMMKNQGND